MFVGGLSVGVGSSPHTRGARQSQRIAHALHGIIPAYAGSTRRPGPGPRWTTDHPRIRGEHPRCVGFGGGDGGSSPHTRGARGRRQGSGAHPGIIPAYAGSTTASARWWQASGDHPRIRGEHEARRIGSINRLGSSPHTRGAPSPETVTAMPNPDHPRIRGEHAPTRLVDRWRDGSSPHTRGAPVRAEPSWRPDGIIPAYAGSTTFQQ